MEIASIEVQKITTRLETLKASREGLRAQLIAHEAAIGELEALLGPKAAQGEAGAEDS